MSSKYRQCRMRPPGKISKIILTNMAIRFKYKYINNHIIDIYI
jgi:hypothetical protein